MFLAQKKAKKSFFRWFLEEFCLGLVIVKKRKEKIILFLPNRFCYLVQAKFWFRTCNHVPKNICLGISIMLPKGKIYDLNEFLVAVSIRSMNLHTFIWPSYLFSSNFCFPNDYLRLPKSLLTPVFDTRKSEYYTTIL